MKTWSVALSGLETVVSGPFPHLGLDTTGGGGRLPFAARLSRAGDMQRGD